MMVPLLMFVAALAASGPAGQAPDLERLPVSSPVKILSLDAKALQGTPSRMAWSPDGTRLYVRMSEYDRWANETARHYLIDVAGRRRMEAEATPGWVTDYWAWKSAPVAPDRPSFAIKLEQVEGVARSTNVPREGTIGQSASDPTADPTGVQTVAAAVWTSQRIVTSTMWLHGQVIAQVVNKPLRPGSTFSWSPASLGLIAYADEKGRLVIMDAAGHLRRVAKTKNVLLPAWSEDGHSLAYFQKTSRTGYNLMIVHIK